MSNKLDIEEIAKEYTREEFLEEAKQRQMGKFDNEEDCPEFFKNSGWKIKCGNISDMD